MEGSATKLNNLKVLLKTEPKVISFISRVLNLPSQQDLS